MNRKLTQPVQGPGRAAKTFDVNHGLSGNRQVADPVVVVSVEIKKPRNHQLRIQSTYGTAGHVPARVSLPRLKKLRMPVR